ncbi:MAG: hypothetical protein K2W95_21885 [Candidatus Obscuribacterales bacterium]|nr:hypothetical protein [Candidatus Obscuribacterales bacterium]
MERFLMLTIGLAFVGGGTYIAKSSLDAKNLMECALFGLLGVTAGLFLVISAVVGPPT